jgi:ribonucleoside-diphosphate reductase alpha chain
VSDNAPLFPDTSHAPTDATEDSSAGQQSAPKTAPKKETKNAPAAKLTREQHDRLIVGGIEHVGPTRSIVAPEQRLGVQRVYTTAGVHPYDAVTWERRDVVQSNWKTGETVFEQRGVEFPDFWSVNAATIVTTKYFRGAVGQEQREWSLRQLIDRVVGTYVQAGIAGEYFAAVEDAEVFGLELTHMLLHQVFSFNSPVWFNVGTPAPQQVSACFILSVDDTMDSILNWYREEGLIFKGGSGAGLNLSRIRSSKELLSSGGTASGPVSFMRGADASAGTIKSGGATRRAAKMVVLDVDHPDIAEFIETKLREEDKIRALRDAGFDMDLGGRDITSVQYQNANNSVRVTDEFMRAVESSTEFGLRARSTGEVLETVDAKGLFRSIADAAWACADPGIQYDDTINDWHTNPETGRITASNPCSEYLSLDNSSCNLASLNLMTFLGDDGVFQAERFRDSVELVITAMEISISFADFPTEPIGATTRAYRQLGIGYANLGALLMATGHAYDSDSGRALAGAITSLMTGTSYRRSAELAGIVGPYAGYARNASAHQRVMRKHAAANDNVRTFGSDDKTILALASQEWSRCLEVGSVNGWRNAQASVLAPTGTIGLMMDCDTTGVEPDLALVKMKKLVGGTSMKIVNHTVPRALRSLGYTEETIEAIVEHISEHGHVIDAPGLKQSDYSVFDCALGARSISPMGHVRMMAAAQPFISGAISKCVVGETLLVTADGLVRIGSMHQGEAPDTFRDEILEVASLDGPQKTDAFYYGGVRPVREVVLHSGQRIVGTPNHRLLVNSSAGLDWKHLSEIVEGDQVATQLGSDLWSSLPARLGDTTPAELHGAVAVPPEMTAELAFLLGAYASRGHLSRSVGSISISHAAPAILDRVVAAWQQVFGLTARIETGPDTCPQVVVSSQRVVELLERLGCGDTASDRRIPDAVLRSPRLMVLAFLQGLALDAYVRADAAWAIRLDSPELLDDLQAVLANLGIQHGRLAPQGNGPGEVFACGAQGQRMVELVPFLDLEQAERATTAVSTGDVVAHPDAYRLHFSPVQVVRDAGEREVFDISVPTTHAFVANGIVNHNTVNMPAEATVEEVEDIYWQGWKLGLKALAIYRDNCKVGQPLTDLKGSKQAGGINEDKSATAASLLAASGELRPTRRRLPKKRAGQTVSFSVAGAEGYMTASVYPDGGLGEVFIKMSKQGSTLAGVMDAFSVSISIALQYGVPLETYVSKFANMRFEPAGMTDDADIRIANSIMDYIFRRLALDHLPFETRAELSIYSAAERARQIETGSYVELGDDLLEVDQTGLAAVIEAHVDARSEGQIEPAAPAERVDLALVTAVDAPLCMNCGVKMRPAGSCYVCESCGSTSGCS